MKLHKSPRRRSPAIGSRRRTKPPHPSPSPRRRTNNYNKSSRPHHKILKRCSSAPPVLLSRDRDHDDDDDGADADADAEFERYMRTESTLFRPKTFSDAFLSSPSHLFPSSPISKGYDKEAKVVVNVTVEGSPGPVRTMVKLGSTVGETIRHVVDIYKEQGRSPKLDNNHDLTSTFQLHQSYFSLQSLEKSKIIGDVGSRSFYLRKSNGASASNEIRTRASVPSIATPPLLLPSFIARKISKIVRRAKRIWNMVVCSQ